MIKLIKIGALFQFGFQSRNAFLLVEEQQADQTTGSGLQPGILKPRNEQRAKTHQRRDNHQQPLVYLARNHLTCLQLNSF